MVNQSQFPSIFYKDKKKWNLERVVGVILFISIYFFRNSSFIAIKSLFSVLKFKNAVFKKINIIKTVFNISSKLKIKLDLG